MGGWTSTAQFKGKIVFDPKDKTNKHKLQSSWKRIAMVTIYGDVSEYYAWFLKKRYNIILNEPLRGAHISFINDSLRDINGGRGSEEKRNKLWNQLKKKYHNTKITITLSTDVRTDGNHWWLVVPEEDRTILHDIRNEIGLERPFYGLHMSIGYAVNGRMDDNFEGNGIRAGRMNLDQSMYIYKLINKGFCS
jgi:hypothetical protein